MYLKVHKKTISFLPVDLILAVATSVCRHVIRIGIAIPFFVLPVARCTSVLVALFLFCDGRIEVIKTNQHVDTDVDHKNHKSGNVPFD